MPWSGVVRPPDDEIKTWGNPWLVAYMFAHPERALRNYQYFIWIGKMRAIYCKEHNTDRDDPQAVSHHFTDWLEKNALHEDNI